MPWDHSLSIVIYLRKDYRYLTFILVLFMILSTSSKSLNHWVCVIPVIVDGDPYVNVRMLFPGQNS